MLKEVGKGGLAAKDSIYAARFAKSVADFIQADFYAMQGMAIPVVEFSSEGYRIRKVSGWKSTDPR